MTGKEPEKDTFLVNKLTFDVGKKKLQSSKKKNEKRYRFGIPANQEPGRRILKGMRPSKNTPACVVRTARVSTAAVVGDRPNYNIEEVGKDSTSVFLFIHYHVYVCL